MSTPPPPDTATATPQPKPQSKLMRVAYAVIAVAAMVIGVVRLLVFFFPGLPACTSDAARTAIGDIFKGKNVELTAVTNQRTLTDGSSEKTCQADFKTPTEAGTLSYRVYWEGKNAQVQITKVDTH